MTLFTPFYRSPDKDEEVASPEVQALRQEIAALHAELDRLRATPAAEPAPQPKPAESGSEPPPPQAA